MKHLYIASILLFSILFTVSCVNRADEDLVAPDNIDGLWMQVAEGNGMCLNIDGERALIADLIVDDKGQYSIASQTNGMIYYDNVRGTGVVTYPSGDFTYSIGSTGMMFSSDKKQYIHLDRSLAQIIAPLSDVPEIGDPDFVGAEPASLHKNIPVVPVPAGITDQILDFVLPIVGRAAITYGCNALFKEVFGSSEEQQMAQILDVLGTINDKLSELTELYKNTTYESYINRRTTYVNELQNYSMEYFTRLGNCDGSDEAISRIVLEWGNGVIGGNKAAVQYKNFADYLENSIIEQKNIYNVYDLYVFNTTPWESQGYDIREGLRAGDASVIAENAILAALYYRCRDDLGEKDKEMMLADIDSAVVRYDRFAKENSVERHDDLAICQIKGARFTMGRDLITRDYYNKPWFPNGTEWDSENNESAWVVVYGDTKYACNEIARSCLSKEEVDTISKYYSSYGYSGFLDILTKEAGCRLPSELEGKKLMMLCRGDAYQEHFEYDDYTIAATLAVPVEKSFTASSQAIGVAYLERYGFLWLSQHFKYWTGSFDRNTGWFRTDIRNRY